MSLSNISNLFNFNLYFAINATECTGQFKIKEVERIFLIGNGGSAAIASHIANDLVKRRISAMTFTDPATLTCLSNDAGYDFAFNYQLMVHRRRPLSLEQHEMLIAISSSGKSENILKAASYARHTNISLVTFTGFDADNPLRKMGDVNYWVPSHNYGIVECAHLAILHSIVNPGVL